MSTAIIAVAFHHNAGTGVLGEECGDGIDFAAFRGGYCEGIECKINGLESGCICDPFAEAFKIIAAFSGEIAVLTGLIAVDRVAKLTVNAAQIAGCEFGIGVTGFCSGTVRCVWNPTRLNIVPASSSRRSCTTA